jgi:hypothetical protein
MKPLDKGSLKGYAKCGPYDKEPGGSAVKVPQSDLGIGDAEPIVLLEKATRMRLHNRHMDLIHLPS